MINPEEIRNRASQRVAIGLVAKSAAGYSELEEFLAPETIPHGTRVEILRAVHRAGDPAADSHVDIVLYEPGLPCPRGAFQLERDEPQRAVREILHAHDHLNLALARQYPAFRKPVTDKIVHSIASENALFAIATALPNIVPNLFELPWAVGEFASDTAFLTVNQVRMAFLISAASGGPVGFLEQKLEVLPIIAGAFGWRAIARELAGKIPLGGGLVPKGAIAYAATFIIGKGLERLHVSGKFETIAEKEELYQQAYERGRSVAQSLSRQES
jgi:hypothetical protein